MKFSTFLLASIAAVLCFGAAAIRHHRHVGPALTLPREMPRAARLEQPQPLADIQWREFPSPPYSDWDMGGAPYWVDLNGTVHFIGSGTVRVLYEGVGWEEVSVGPGMELTWNGTDRWFLGPL